MNIEGGGEQTLTTVLERRFIYQPNSIYLHFSFILETWQLETCKASKNHYFHSIVFFSKWTTLSILWKWPWSRILIFPQQCHVFYAYRSNIPVTSQKPGLLWFCGKRERSALCWLWWQVQDVPSKSVSPQKRKERTKWGRMICWKMYSYVQESIDDGLRERFKVYTQSYN